ncbi:hypothetical protein BHE74_00056266 [Ensete ventricosum]|nr:hypothetical protein BHE74_00056266 [Ensete ventricosum]
MKSGGGGRKEVAALLPAEAVAVVVGFVHVQAEVIQPAAAASASSPEIVPSSAYHVLHGDAVSDISYSTSGNYWVDSYSTPRLH